MTDHRHSGEPETPQTEADVADALAMALAGNGYVDDDRQEQYRLIDARPIIASLAMRGYVIVPREALAAPGAGLDVERLAKRLREWMDVVLNERKPKYLSDDIGTLIAAGDEQGYRELARRIAEYQRLGATPDPGPDGSAEEAGRG